MRSWFLCRKSKEDCEEKESAYFAQSVESSVIQNDTSLLEEREHYVTSASWAHGKSYDLNPIENYYGLLEEIGEGTNKVAEGGEEEGLFVVGPDERRLPVPALHQGVTKANIN